MTYWLENANSAKSIWDKPQVTVVGNSKLPTDSYNIFGLVIPSVIIEKKVHKPNPFWSN